MSPAQIKEYYVTWANCMRKLGLSKCAYQSWIRQDRVPYHAQIRIQEATKGALKISCEEAILFEKRKERISKMLKVYYQKPGEKYKEDPNYKPEDSELP